MVVLSDQQAGGRHGREHSACVGRREMENKRRGRNISRGLFGFLLPPPERGSPGQFGDRNGAFSSSWGSCDAQRPPRVACGTSVRFAAIYIISCSLLATPCAKVGLGRSWSRLRFPVRLFAAP